MEYIGRHERDPDPYADLGPHMILRALHIVVSVLLFPFLQLVRHFRR
ncbi:MAG: hypothetical protein HN712_06725 [Gemmatimonadetes bacterium]|nr:hypothetical protein [Gemmatimonadota bacterium]MBT7859989.1 hypothetical protein [Gemmatimonadota bacterium]